MTQPANRLIADAIQPKDVDRFFRKVEFAGCGCWLWRSTKDHRGYGQFYHQGWVHRAHRFSFVLTGNHIPDGLVIDHLCRTPLCVNPDHLEAVTSHENLLRGTALITSCPKGHPYDEANTYRDKNGHRTCRACHRIHEANRVRGGYRPHVLLTHCLRGHPRTPETIKASTNNCKTCINEKAREIRAVRQERVRNRVSA